jgi:hypothetical protein
MFRSVGKAAAVCAVLCLSAGAGIGLISIGSAGAATVFNVNDTSDLGLDTTGGTTCVSTASTCTLRSAIEASDNLGVGTAVDINLVASSTYLIGNAYNSGDQLGTGEFKIAGDVTITGQGQASTIVDGASLDRVFVVESGATAIIQDLTIQHGESDLSNGSEGATGGFFADGGGIANAGTLTLTDDTVAHNTAEDGYGGGVAAVGGTGPTTLSGTTVEVNTAVDSGGGVYDASGSTADGVTIENSSAIDGNTADENGGGIVSFAQSPVTLTITDSAVNGNYADDSGAGIGVEDHENLDITDSQIENNTVDNSENEGYGGGMWLLLGGTDTYTGDTISGNKADNGGGVADESGTQTFTDSTIEDNGAAVGGGGFLVDSANVGLTINQSLIDNNEASGEESNGEVTSGAGGGIYDHACASIHLTNDTLYANNAASSEGGGLFSNNCESGGATVFFVNDSIVQNLGIGNGANLNVGSDVGVSLTNSIVSGADGFNCDVTDLTSGGYNLEDDETCDPNGSTDIVHSAELDGLAQNGGPTETLLPDPGSPVIAAIPDASCTVTVDQREFSRHAGTDGSCTIGALEVGGTAVTPPPTTTTTTTTTPPPVVVPPGGYNPNGYRLAAKDGGAFDFGIQFGGSLASQTLNAPIVGLANEPGAYGYLMVGADGGVFTFGGAQYYGSLGGQKLASPIAGIATTPDGGGYWLVSQSGTTYNFGDAPPIGSMSGLNKPIVGIATDPSGKGAWLVAADGGVFTLGTGATFEGSLGNVHLNAPIVGIAPSPNGQGYVLAAADGGTFAFPNALFQGSAANLHLNAPIVGIAETHSGNGYWLVGADGGVFNFGDAPFLGSMGGTKLNAPIVGIQHLGGTPV